MGTCVASAGKEVPDVHTMSLIVLKKPMVNTAKRK